MSGDVVRDRRSAEFTFYDSRRSAEVQAAHAWTPPTGTLGELVAAARRRGAALDADALRRAALQRAAVDAPPSFAAALRRADVAVIAEVKRRSP